MRMYNATVNRTSYINTDTQKHCAGSSKLDSWMVCSSLWSQLLFDPQRNDFSRLSNESTQSRHETPVWRPLWLLGELTDIWCILLRFILTQTMKRNREELLQKLQSGGQRLWCYHSLGVWAHYLSNVYLFFKTQNSLCLGSWHNQVFLQEMLEYWHYQGCH